MRPVVVTGPPRAEAEAHQRVYPQVTEVPA